MNEVEIGQYRFAIRVSPSPIDVQMESVCAVVGSFDVVGQAINGTQVNLPGWILVRLLGDPVDDTLLRYDAENDCTAFDLDASTVRTRLEDDLDTQVLSGFELEIDGLVVPADQEFVRGEPRRCVLVTPVLTDEPARWAMAEVDFSVRSARVGAFELHERAEELSDELLHDDLTAGLAPLASSFGRRPVVLLVRHGALTGVWVLRKDKIRVAAFWEPGWTTILPVSYHLHDLEHMVAHVVEDLALSTDVDAFVDEFSPLDPPNRVRLRAALRRSPADLEDLMVALGLPVQAAHIVDGSLRIRDLDHVVEREATTFRALLRDEIVAAPEGRISARLDTMAVQGHWFYKLWQTACLVIELGLVTLALEGHVPVWAGILAGAFGIFTVVEIFAVRWLRRARAAER